MTGQLLKLIPNCGLNVVLATTSPDFSWAADACGMLVLFLIVLTAVASRFLNDFFLPNLLPESVESPEALNFRPDPRMIDRLRHGQAGVWNPVPLMISDPQVRSNWLRNRIPIQLGFPSFEDSRTPVNGGEVLREYASRKSVHCVKTRREFLLISEGVKALGSALLPEPRHAGVEVDEIGTEVHYRDWTAIDATDFRPVTERLQATEGQLLELVIALRQLRRLGLRIEKLALWTLLRKPDGTFYIPRLPQNLNARFPVEAQHRVYPSSDLLAHLLDPHGGHRDNNFEYRFGTFCWRLLSGRYPYDQAPALLQVGAQPEFQPHLFHTARTSRVLSRMVHLTEKERYGDLDLMFTELEEALGGEK